MPEDASRQDADKIRETDIIFDCPHCGKSLAIDYRGAGLTIPCSDCGKQVAVPIPEGMQLSDIDSSDEEQEIRILNLRRSLEAAQYRAKSLENEVRELTARREALEKGRAQNLFRFGTIQEKVGAIEAALEEIRNALEVISETSKKDT